MGFNSVFRSLQEVFPQVDVRMLRAVAIEHSKDVDAAVEFILFEVLPSLCPPEGPLALNDKQEIKHPSTVEAESVDQIFSLMHEDAVEKASASTLLEPKSVDCEDLYGTYNTSDSLYVNSSCLDEAEAGSSVSSDHDRNDHDQVCAETETEESIFLAKNEEVNLIVGLPLSPDASSSMTHEDVSITDHRRDALCSDTQSSNEVLSYDSVSATCRGKNQNDLCLGTNSFKEESLPITVYFPSPVHEEAADSRETLALSGNDPTNFVSEYEEPGARVSSQKGSEELTFDTELVDVDNNSQLTTTTTRSGQIVSIDFLEDIIRDAKDNKKNLFLAIESVFSMIREVELQEKAAQQAKEEASKGGLDIFAKVEDLRQMLQHAREANDMHAGEVYGERAILATEARELQCRLLNLADERDKSLSILNEMRRDLEARLAVAEGEKAAAEQEKLQKEEAGRMALAEQELIMDKVVEESKKLSKEAEENSKLREYLLNRGHIVDMLQGEIAVICEDVKLLKERVDERVPITKSLSASQISCILASSSASFQSLSSDRHLERTDLSDSLKTSLEGSEGTETDMKEKNVCGDLKAPSDDEWDLFEDEVLLHS